MQSMPSALSVLRGNECKIIVNEKMRFSFVGPMLDLLPLEIIPVVLIPHISNTFGIAVTSVKLKNDLNPCIPNRNIPVFSEYGFRLAELFLAAKP